MDQPNSGRGEPRGQILEVNRSPNLVRESLGEPGEPPKPPTPESTNAAPTLPRPQGTVVLADRGPQHTSWVFGHRLRSAGLLGSTGRVASSVDNALIESFWSTIQRELLDRHQWQSRSDFESLHDTAQPAA